MERGLLTTELISVSLFTARGVSASLRAHEFNATCNGTCNETLVARTGYSFDVCSSCLLRHALHYTRRKRRRSLWVAEAMRFLNIVRPPHAYRQ